MSTLGSILNIARSAVSAHQTAVRVASHNISNAQTEGFTRQRVTFVDARPDQTPLGRLGAGVVVHDIARIRDTLLDVSYRREAGRTAGYEQRFEMLGQVEQILGEPSEQGLASMLDAFFSSWSELASHPASSAARGLVGQRAQQVSSLLHGFTARLDEVRDLTRTRVTGAVTELNQLAKQVAATNEQIVREEAGGQTASDLRDHRDRLLDSMAKLGSIQIVERGNGSIAVAIENRTVVDGSDFKTLSDVGEPPSIHLGGRPLTFSTEGGKLGELVGMLNRTLPDLEDRLDNLAAGLVAQVNALHRAGFAPDGSPGGNFFDPAGTTARSIAVVVDPARIAASSDAAESTNNQIATAMAALRGKPQHNQIALGIWTPAERDALGGLSFAEHYQETVTGLAFATQTAETSATVHESLLQQVDARRQSVMGVSTDEELIRVMQHQHAYTAAARLVNVVDEMMQTVINLGR